MPDAAAADMISRLRAGDKNVSKGASNWSVIED